MAVLDLRLMSIQDLAHRRLRDIVVQYHVKYVYATYSEDGVVYYVNKVDECYEVLEKAYHATSDFDNITFKVYGEGYTKLPEDSFLCFKEGVWFG